MYAKNFEFDRTTNRIAAAAAFVAAGVIFVPVLLALIGPFVG